MFLNVVVCFKYRMFKLTFTLTGEAIVHLQLAFPHRFVSIVNLQLA